MAKKYFRIKNDGSNTCGYNGTFVYEYHSDYDKDYVKVKYHTYVIDKYNILKWANTLPTLCDMFVVVGENQQPIPFYSLKLAKKSVRHTKARIYGAIWVYSVYKNVRPALIPVCELKESKWELL